MKKIKTTFTALVSLFAIFAMALSMLVFPAKGNANATASDPNAVHVTDLFSFTDEPATTLTFIGQAKNNLLPAFAKDGSLVASTNAAGYADYTNKGAYISISKSVNDTGAPASGVWGNTTNVNNVGKTATFSLKDNTVDDVLFSFIPLPQGGSRYQESSENGTESAATLLAAGKLPTARDFYVKIVNEANSDQWLRLNFKYRTGANATYECSDLTLKTNSAVSMKIQSGGAVGANVGDSVAVPDVAWLKYNAMNRIYYNAEDNALYADLMNGGAVTPKQLIRDFDYDYSDGADLSWIKDNSVHLEFYFVGGGGTTCYFIGDLDGVNLATDEDGYISRDEVVAYNNRADGYYTAFPEVEFTSAKEYALPAIANVNMFTTGSYNEALTAQYYVTVTDGEGRNCGELLSGLNDGRWTANAKFTPVKEGNYTIKYTFGTSVYTLTAKITKDKAAGEMFTLSSGISMSYDTTAPSFMTSLTEEGLGFSWTTGGTIAIDKEFDARLFTLDRPIIEFAVTPKVQSTYKGDATPTTEYEFDNLIVRLTDAVDAKKYVDFYVNASRFGNGLAFGTVGANGQQYANNKVLNGFKFGAFTSNNGITINSDWMGTAKNTTKVYYDYKTQETAIAPSTYKNPVALSGDRFMLRDLDLMDHLLGSDTAFGGFTSGRIKLSVIVSDALRDDANMIVYSILGQRLGGEIVADVTAPEITDVNGFDAIEPNAQVGVEFPLPVVTAFDVMSGERTAQMWATLVDPAGNPVEIEDGKFVPAKTGEYTYTVYANDELLNVSHKEFKIKAVKKVPSVYLTLKDANGAPYEYKATAKVGESVKTPIYSVVGGSGNKTVEYTVIDPDGQLVDISTSTIEFTKQGLYTARYVVTDYIGIPKTFEYFTSVSYSETPVISDVNIPKAILAGKSITLPKPVAYDYYSYLGERREAAVEVTVTEQDKEPVKLGSDFKFTPTITSGTVTIEYKAKALLDSSNVSPAKTYTTTVISPATTGEYFVREGFGISYEKVDKYGSAEAVFSTTTPDSSLTFVNALAAIGFNITLVSLPGSDMQAVDIVLTDSVNADQKVVLSLTQVGAATGVSVNGGEVKIASGSFAAENTFKLSIRSGYKVMDTTNATLAIISDTYYGEAFNGFTSGKVYMDVVVREVGEAGASFAIRDLVNQARFNDKITDNQSPYITLDHEYTLYNTFGSEISLSKAVAADVLDPNATVTLTVTAPDGTKVYNAIPADVERTLKLENYGTYVVQYRAIDAGNKVTTRSYNIVSYDNVKPVLEIEGAVKTSYKTGEKFVVNNARATDNVSQPDDMTVYVIITELFTGKVKTYAVADYGTKNDITKEMNEFVFEKTGTYTVKYYVRDESANFAQSVFTVTVTE